MAHVLRERSGVMIGDLEDLRVDSKEGIEYLFRWAKSHGFVLSEAHEKIGRKHGISTDGVIISRPLPLV
jgi:hypothetical protein